jgi:hypothetical protein
VEIRVHELETITAISPGITELSQGIEALLALPARATWELNLQLHLKLSINLHFTFSRASGFSTCRRPRDIDDIVPPAPNLT